MRVPSPQESWKKKRQGGLDASELGQFLATESSTIRAVVIKDLCKGVVFAELIQWLAQRLEDIPWYVSTEMWRPDWFTHLPHESVQLLVVPQIAAQMAVQRGEINRWINESGYATKEALDAMDSLGNRFSNARVVALPEGLRVLGRDWNSQGRKGVLQKVYGPSPPTDNVPMASVLFPAIVANLEQDRPHRLANAAAAVSALYLSVDVSGSRANNDARGLVSK